MKRIAVIASGISGLAAAYYLSRKHQVFLLEREFRLGGPTHTVTVESSQGRCRSTPDSSFTTNAGIQT